MIKNKIAIIFILFISCAKSPEKESNNIEVMDLKKTSKMVLDSLFQKKIYFGHQSVGYNILDGIEEKNIALNIVESDDISAFNKPALVHSRNGQNGDPTSKINAFYSKMNSIGEVVDIAGFKFCYVDFTSSTNIQDIFNLYKSKMNELSLKYPNVKFVHFTVPLRTLQKGPKALIKKILGKSIGIEDNLSRKQFNDLLIKEYESEYIFDIATLESTYPNGERQYVKVNGQKVYLLIEDYTNDGGHLSDEGKSVIAENLIFLLSKISNE